MKRYIKLDDLQKFPIRQDHYDKENGNEHFINGIETVFEYAENLPTYDIAQKNEWISVKDRLPERKQMVLGYTPCDGFMFVGIYNGVGWNIITAMRSTKCMTKTVTHWMQLPEPPKGE